MAAQVAAHDAREEVNDIILKLTRSSSLASFYSAVPAENVSKLLRNLAQKRTRMAKAKAGSGSALALVTMKAIANN